MIIWIVMLELSMKPLVSESIVKTNGTRAVGSKIQNYFQELSSDLYV
jgi:hypothetical protein